MVKHLAYFGAFPAHFRRRALRSGAVCGISRPAISASGCARTPLPALSDRANFRRVCGVSAPVGVAFPHRQHPGGIRIFCGGMAFGARIGAGATPREKGARNAWAKAAKQTRPARRLGPGSEDFPVLGERPVSACCACGPPRGPLLRARLRLRMRRARELRNSKPPLWSSRPGIWKCRALRRSRRTCPPLRRSSWR